MGKTTVWAYFAFLLLPIPFFFFLFFFFSSPFNPHNRQKHVLHTPLSVYFPPLLLFLGIVFIASLPRSVVSTHYRKRTLKKKKHMHTLAAASFSRAAAAAAATRHSRNAYTHTHSGTDNFFTSGRAVFFNLPTISIDGDANHRE